MPGAVGINNSQLIFCILVNEPEWVQYLIKGFKLLVAPVREAPYYF